jgi:ABC-type transport system involved in multi-copper enzyme maturation permease subunit
MAAESSGIGTLAKQFEAAFTLAMQRFARSRFMLVCLLLSAIPVAIALAIAIFAPVEEDGMQFVHLVYEFMLRFIYLHFVVFFTAFIFGFSVMRQDMEDQTLHFLLLQPADRWVLVAGKFAAYLALATVSCTLSFWAVYVILAGGRAGAGALVSDLFSSGRFGMLAAETGVLILGLIAYGAIAAAASLFFKSAFFALIVLAWESLLPYLPSMLKMWTVSHYLHSMLPERLIKQRKAIELLGEPAPLELCIGVLMGMSLVMLAIAVVRFQSRECVYTES